MALKIDDEFKSLIPPLSEDEYNQLKENLKADGCREPLVVWGETLIDGHNRYKICEEENIPYKITAHKFNDRSEAIHWIILNQFGRRNLTAFQRSELALKLKPILQKEAKEKQVATLKQNTDSQKSDERTGEKPKRTEIYHTLVAVSL